MRRSGLLRRRGRRFLRGGEGREGGGGLGLRECICMGVS